MKRIVYGSIAVIALMATSGAFADDNRLTTKDYVDSGLNYLYQRYEPLKTTVGDATSGLVKDVADLKANSSAATVQQLQSDVSDLEAIVGTQGDGTTTQSTGLVADVEDLQDTVGNSTGGLVKEVADLKDQVDAIDVPEYVGSDSITITEKANGEKVIAINPDNVVSSWADDAPSWAQQETQTTP